MGKKQEDLVVTKKSNILDKPKASQGGKSQPPGGGVSQDVDVRKLTMVVMDEVHKQMGEIAAKQKERIDEMGAEIRKLKAMIVKHESRIRTLETKNRDLESQVTRGGAGGSGISYNNGDHDDDMDPDEV